MSTEHGGLLVVDDDETNREVLAHRLERRGYAVTPAVDGAEALRLISRQRFDLVLLDVVMPGPNGLEVLRELRRTHSLTDLPVIMATAKDQSADVVRALELGAHDYVTKPYDFPVLLARVHTQLMLRRAVAQIGYLREEIQSTANFEEIVGSSSALTAILDKVRRVAPTDSTVLIEGETGTGKELIARAIHHASPRREQPLVKVNCGAIPAGLVESELFGHEEGAFTGAQARRVGRFELAHGGTILLDEVGELPIEVQVKLLHVLQDRRFERVGNSRPREVDVRVLAATNRDLAQAVRDKRFREDLYYRLNVVPLVVPPLRERREDIPLLARHFLAKLSRRLGKRFDDVESAVLHRLSQYCWPGNVRELQNVIERAAVLSPGPALVIEDRLAASDGQAVAERAACTLEEAERTHLLFVLEKAGWVIEGKGGAAEVLGLRPSTLRSRMNKLGIRRGEKPPARGF